MSDIPSLPEIPSVPAVPAVADPALAPVVAPDAPALVDASAPAVASVKGIMQFFSQGGQFSKTAVFATVANVLVLLTYAIQSWFAGAVFTTSWLSFTVPAFNSGDAATILTIINGTYLGGNLIKKQ